MPRVCTRSALRTALRPANSLPTSWPSIDRTACAPRAHGDAGARRNLCPATRGPRTSWTIVASVKMRSRRRDPRGRARDRATRKIKRFRRVRWLPERFREVATGVCDTRGHFLRRECRHPELHRELAAGLWRLCPENVQSRRVDVDAPRMLSSSPRAARPHRRDQGRRVRRACIRSADRQAQRYVPHPPTEAARPAPEHHAASIARLSGQSWRSPIAQIEKRALHIGWSKPVRTARPRDGGMRS